MALNFMQRNQLRYTAFWQRLPLCVALIVSCVAHLAFAGEGDVSYAKGREAIKRGDTGTAERAYVRALYNEPGHREAMLALIDLYVAQKRYDEADAKIALWHEQAGPDAQLLLHRGFIYQHTGRQSDATQAYTAALELAPNDPTVLASAAGYYYSIGDRTRAETLSQLRTQLLEGTASP